MAVIWICAIYLKNRLLHSRMISLFHCLTCHINIVILKCSEFLNWNFLLAGPERKSAVIEAENRKLVAYHEGGHAIVAIFTPGNAPTPISTILPTAHTTPHTVPKVLLLLFFEPMTDSIQ